MTTSMKRYVVTCCDWTRYDIVVHAPDAETAQQIAYDRWADEGASAFKSVTGSTDDFCATLAPLSA